VSTLFLVDNSVIQRLTQPHVRDAWSGLCDRGEIATCLPALLEVGFSARSAADHQRLMVLEQSAKLILTPDAGILPIALRIQSALFTAGAGRSVGVSDLQIAATAIHHSTTAQPVVVVHYDSDFDMVARVEPQFRSEWIVSRGSAD
jgi:predicted nucleic acid-binding protein